MTWYEERRIAANGIDITVATAGAGPALLLLHGFPHTWRVWARVMPSLARCRRVIAPDLRGIGGTTRAADGYDLATIAADLLGLLDALGEPVADVAGLDLGVGPALLLAWRHPARVRRLVVMEGLGGDAPDFPPPWWFGFHQVPGLAERVLAGHEAEYLDFFLTAGGGLPERDAFVAAYEGSLGFALEHYRAMPEGSRQLAAAAAAGRLTVPTLAVGARPVGELLHRRLLPHADDLTGHLIPDCRHIIPLDRPDALLAVMSPFLRR